MAPRLPGYWPQKGNQLVDAVGLRQQAIGSRDEAALQLAANFSTLIALKSCTPPPTMMVSMGDLLDL